VTGHDDARPTTAPPFPGRGVVSLRADVELLDAERAALANRVLALDADVAELESAVESLEGTVDFVSNA